MSRPNRVLVVGGGIGGTTLALQLGRAGISADIAEIESEWTFRGIGISLLPAAMRSLDHLGVLQDCIAAGIPHGDTEVFSSDGELLSKTSLPSLTGPEDPPTIGMPRGELGRILYEHALAAGATARMGTTVANLEDDGDGVNVLFTDGAQDRYDLVVGADGVQSKMRQTLFPDHGPPTFLGQSIWRVLVGRRYPQVRGQMIYLGETTRAGFTPITPDNMYVYLLHETEEGEPWLSHESSVQLFLDLLGEYGGLLSKAHGEISLDSPYHYGPLYTTFVEGEWHRGRVVLIGDAAHATPPHLASGAAIAIEDAIVLPELLSQTDSVEEALDEFTRRRYDRCRMVVRNSQLMSEWDRDPSVDGAQAAQLTAESWQLLAEPI